MTLETIAPGYFFLSPRAHPHLLDIRLGSNANARHANWGTPGLLLGMVQISPGILAQKLSIAAKGFEDGDRSDDERVQVKFRYGEKLRRRVNHDPSAFQEFAECGLVLFAVWRSWLWDLTSWHYYHELPLHSPLELHLLPRTRCRQALSAWRACDMP